MPSTWPESRCRLRAASTIPPIVPATHAAQIDQASLAAVRDGAGVLVRAGCPCGRAGGCWSPAASWSIAASTRTRWHGPLSLVRFMLRDDCDGFVTAGPGDHDQLDTGAGSHRAGCPVTCPCLCASRWYQAVGQSSGVTCTAALPVATLSLDLGACSGSVDTARRLRLKTARSAV